MNFENPDKLISSLELKPTNRSLLRTNDSLDESVLRFFLKKGANNIIYHKNLKLLWECCQIPDFEKKAYGQHINVIDKVFQFLSTRKNRIPSTFMKEQLKGLERDHGNVDLLSHRLSNVRTWSYVANKKIGLKILTIGFNLQRVLRINYRINSMMSLLKVLLIKKLVFFHEV